VIDLYNAENMRVIDLSAEQRARLHHEVEITALSFFTNENNETWLATAGADRAPSKRVRVWKFKNENNTLREIPATYRELGFATGRPSLLRWDEDRLVIAGDTPQLDLWDMSLEPIMGSTDHAVIPIGFAPIKALGIREHKVIAFGWEGTQPHIWDPTTTFAGLTPQSLEYWLKWFRTAGSHWLIGFVLAGGFGLGLVFLGPNLLSGATAQLMYPELDGKDRARARRFTRDRLVGITQLEQYVDENGTHIKNAKNGAKKNGTSDTATKNGKDGTTAKDDKKDAAAPSSTESTATAGEEDRTAVMDALGGPGILTVPEGYAAVMERGGAITHVVGAGTYWLEQSEKAVMRVHLFPRTTAVEVKDVWTRDQVLVTVHFSVRHEINRGDPRTDPERPGHENDRYRFDTRIIRDRIWSPQRKPDSDWKGTIESVTRNQARQLIAQYTLEDLIAGAGAARTLLRDALSERLRKTMRASGVNVMSVSVGEVNVPSDFSELLQKRSKSEMEQRFKLQEADKQNALTVRKNEVDMKVMEQMGRIKFKLREDMIKQLTEPLRQDGAFANRDVAIRYLETMERIMQQMARDDFTTQRFIETMEKLVESGGENHFYFPDVRELIGAGAAPPKEK